MSYHPLSLDVRTVSELYSQLSGVLAGFALAAVFIVISHYLGEAQPTGRREEALGQALPALLAALLGLVFSSLTYSIVAADGDNRDRAQFEYLVAGVGFSVAGALLIFAAVLLIEGVLPYDPVHYARRLLGQGAPLPMFALLCDGAYAYGKAYYGGRVPGWLGVLIVLLLSLMLAVSVLGFAAYGRPGLDGSRVTGGGDIRTIAVSVLSIVTVCLLGVVATKGLADTRCAVRIGAVVAVLLCGFLAAVGMCVWFFVTRPARPTAPVPAPTRAAVA
ncbi:hypothetical protein [Streptomyces sp. HUAS TT20]|uniref:hypothetical protein n=1 Tax=Streptomyces sp. HUAS TT20 TaxID=3447509 RepID=UPI0021D99718|nr:hypothetical protein [Streptomyces sp. HUAS 15-9]UXY29463.1 hypothetical protein N8I87_24815 [Streptomyces sp. HUAS 15-9]